MVEGDMRAKEQGALSNCNLKTFANPAAFWQSMSPYMRVFRWVFVGIFAVLPWFSHAADKPENVALQYHYLGATQLATNPNVEVAKKVFALTTTIRFEDLVLNRLSGQLAESLHFQTNAETSELLRPLLDDLTTSESLGSMGGIAEKPLNYVIAVHLTPDRAALWQRNLKTAGQGKGEAFPADAFSGWQWNKDAADSFWMVSANDWMLVGRGQDLSTVRDGYLQQIQKTGRPAPALDFNWFEADVDWPRLANWLPLSSFPLKLGRTQVAISAENQSFHMTSQVTYDQAIDWHPQPWRIPTNLVRQPLVSFATGQDVEPFLKSNETLSHLASDPMKGQFFFWSMREMPFESYLAWPVENSTNLIEQLATQLPAVLNPDLKRLNGSELEWAENYKQIIWTKIQLTRPVLTAAPPKDGNFLLAGLFFHTEGSGPAPEQLWEQFNGRPDLVYYDWEYTGPRLLALRLIAQEFPILQALGMTPVPQVLSPDVMSRLNLEEQWLDGLTGALQNTVTEVTKTGPNELTVVRNSPLVFSSFELILMSHWLSDTPPGPVNKNLLPQPKITGPGIH